MIKVQGINLKDATLPDAIAAMVEAWLDAQEAGGQPVARPRDTEAWDSLGYNDKICLARFWFLWRDKEDPVFAGELQSGSDRAVVNRLVKKGWLATRSVPFTETNESGRQIGGARRYVWPGHMLSNAVTKEIEANYPAGLEGLSARMGSPPMEAP